jgi:beta-galactosidase
MAAADELGLVLLNSVLGWQFYNDDPRFERQVSQTCRDLIRRDRNHPSAILWECSLNETQMPASLVRKLHQIVHEEYPGDQAFSAGWQNDGYDAYIQARQHRVQHYEKPDRPYLVSEYGDWEYYALNAGFQQHAWGNLQPDERTSRQLLSAGEARLLQQATNIQEAHNDNFTTPAFADAYWAMFDYNRGYAEDLEASGVMSLDRVPKLSYYFFRTQRDATQRSPRFASGPEVFIASYWQPQSATDVHVFGNVEEVELRLDGRSLGRRTPDVDRMSTHLRHAPFTFQLDAFSHGVLEAIGYIGGHGVAWHRVITPEAPTRLEVTLDDAGVCIDKDRGDLVFVRATLRDRNGSVVPLSGREVEFSVTHGATIVGPRQLPTEAGIASALLRVEPAHGEATITAGSGELRARFDLSTKGNCRRASFD